jgi:hypothetical protein
MTDLTKITSAFGLLDMGTQEALRAHGGPYQQYTGFMWEERAEPAWWSVGVYRVKPQPPKPRDFWLTDNGCYWFTREDAMNAYGDPGEKIIHVREVLPDE